MTDFQDIHWEQAVAAFDRGHLEESIEHFRRALARLPDNSDLHLNLALVLDRSGDSQGAGAEYREAVRLNPSEALLHYGLGTHFLKTEQWDKALASFRQAVQLQPGYHDALNDSAITLGRKAKAFGQADDYRAYLDAVEQMLSLFPEKLVWRENRAWALWEMGRRSEAVAEADALLSLEPTSRNYSRVLHYQRRLGRWRDFLRTGRAMWQFEVKKGCRKLAWEKSKIEETQTGGKKRK